MQSLLSDFGLHDVWKLISLKALDVDVDVVALQGLEVTVTRPLWIKDEFLELAEELLTRFSQINLWVQVSDVASLWVDDVFYSNAEEESVVDFKAILNFVLELVGLGPRSKFQEAKLGLVDGLKVVE